MFGGWEPVSHTENINLHIESYIEYATQAASFFFSQ